MRVKLVISYDGSEFYGYQRQEEKRTVQGVIEKILSDFFKIEIKTIGASRTDAKVHSKGQTLVFDIDRKTVKMPVEKIYLVVNKILPQDIKVLSSKEVSENFNPRYDALKKVYIYTIYNGDILPPMYRNYMVLVKGHIDINKMEKAKNKLVGKHDFKGFSNVGSDIRNTVRTIESIDIIKVNNIIEIKIVGNGFLYNMVRIIASTLIEISLRKKNDNIIDKVLETRDRKLASKTGRPEGLTLDNILYKEE